MNNKYEERLGTERMLPLVFKMALPAVAAQFVNLLYSIVDRIYIGHIPGIGTDALAGVGVTTSLIILISSFSAIVGGGGAPLAAIALGQGDRVRAGKIFMKSWSRVIQRSSGEDAPQSFPALLSAGFRCAMSMTIITLMTSIRESLSAVIRRSSSACWKELR